MFFKEHLAPLGGANWRKVNQNRICEISRVVASTGSGWSLPADYLDFLSTCDGSIHKENWNWDAAHSANGMIEWCYGVNHNPTAKDNLWMPLESIWKFKRGDCMADWMFPIGENSVGCWAISVRPYDNGCIYYLERGSIGRVSYDQRKPEYQSFRKLFEAFLHGYSDLAVC